MKHPAYNLRPNKAVDRSLLVERLLELENVELLNTRRAAYYGFGGPFLDDFRILLDQFPKMVFHSLEKSLHTYHRQKFHKFSHRVKLHHRTVEGFLVNEEMESKDHLIWWLDFTTLGTNQLNDITSLANSLTPGDFLRITAKADPKFETDNLVDLLGDSAALTALRAHIEDFAVNYETYLPAQFDRNSIVDADQFPFLCIRMIENALERRNNLSATRIWNLGSRVYRDGVQMVTCEFYISPKTPSCSKKAHNLLLKLESESSNIEVINVPNLSIKERLMLEAYLPKDPQRVSRVSNKIGYRIDDSGKRHEEALKQYVKFHKHYPMLGKVSQ